MLSRRQFLRTGAGAALGVPLLGNLDLGGPAGPSFPVLSQPESSLERRREYLAVLRRVLRETRPEIPGREGRISATSESWEDWVEVTGELPPDFHLMPSRPLLPDPLVDHAGDGGRIDTLEAWEKQRAWIREEYQKWIIGRLPPRPENLVGTVDEVRRDGESTRYFTTLRFGPGMEGSLRLEVFVPDGNGPFPAFVTPHTPNMVWVKTPLRRGYVVCICKAADPLRFDGDDSDAWIELYPDFDFSGLARWAWAVMRAIDHLQTLPFVDPERIATGGNSRYAKSTLIAAAFDERIGAALPSRGNCGCGIPWRHTTGMFSNEGLEEITRVHRHWFHPRLRFFTGREDKLPVDQNLLASLVAPRGLLLSHAFTEHQGNPWAIEQTYRSVKSVYRFLGAEDHLGLLQRPGEHTVMAPVVELYMDFCDGVFGRVPLETPKDIVNGYTFEGWRKATEGSNSSVPDPPLQRSPWQLDLDRGVPWPTIRIRMKRRVRWLLGDTPPSLERPLDNRVTYRSTEGRNRSIVYPRTLFNRPMLHEKLGMARVNFGDRLRGDMYYATDRKDGWPKWNENLPTVIWLHPYAYAQGYYRALFSGTFRAFRSLTSKGFAAIALDLVGHGLRVEETKRFYHRYPRFSMLGRMVADMQALITAIRGLREVGNDRIYVVGSGLGAKVALFHAALDRRTKGVAAVSGFSSLRLGSSGGTTEGLRHYSHLHGILPRLGRYLDDPREVPADYDQVLALIAPRPTLVVAPTFDRYHPVEGVRSMVDSARRAFGIFGKEATLELRTPEGFNGLETEPERAEQVVDWLVEQEDG